MCSSLSPNWAANHLADAWCTNVYPCNSSNYGPACGTLPPTPPTSPRPPTNAPAPTPPYTTPPTFKTLTASDIYNWTAICPWAVDVLTQCSSTLCSIPANDVTCASTACNAYCVTKYANQSCIEFVNNLCTSTISVYSCPSNLCQPSGYMQYVISTTTHHTGTAASKHPLEVISVVVVAWLMLIG